MLPIPTSGMNLGVMKPWDRSAQCSSEGGRNSNGSASADLNSINEKFNLLKEKLSDLETKMNNDKKIWEDELMKLRRLQDLFPGQLEKVTECVTEQINKLRHDICQHSAQSQDSSSSTTGNYSKRHNPQQRRYSKNAETTGMNETSEKLQGLKI